MSSIGDFCNLSPIADFATMSSIGDIMPIRTPGDLGLLIRDRRKQLGLDQQALAQRAGVSRQWIVEVEQGKSRAAIGLLLKTLRALDLDLEATPAPSESRPDGPGAIDLDRVIDRAKSRKR
jgi:HTH-type transcriptional regulator/antitoxin HipB